MLRRKPTRSLAGRFGVLSSFCVLVICSVGESARAEFTVGAEIPAFSLQTPDGNAVAVERVSGDIHLKRNGKSETPKVLAIHLLQPDCLQCRAQLKALQTLHDRFGQQGLVILGISHRGDEKALASLGGELHLTFPLLMGSGSELARQFAAGDTLGLVDRGGVIRFAQVGYGAGDEKTWAQNVELMLEGQPPAKESIDRERLKVGDSFPAVVLPSLHSGKPMELVGKDGKLTFRSEDGKETQPKGAVGFFSRY